MVTLSSSYHVSTMEEVLNTTIGNKNSEDLEDFFLTKGFLDRSQLIVFLNMSTI